MPVFVLLNTKEDILKNEGNRAVFFSYYWSQWCPKTAWLQTFFRISSFVFRTNTFIQVWIYLRVNKWWQNFHFWVNYPFKTAEADCHPKKSAAFGPFQLFINVYGGYSPDLNGRTDSRVSHAMHSSAARFVSLTPDSMHAKEVDASRRICRPLGLRVCLFE